MTWLAPEPGPVGTDTGKLGLFADAGYEDLPDPEVVIVPGGTGTDAVLDDERLVGWIRARTRPPSGRPRSARDPCCSAPRECSTGSRRPPIGSTSTAGALRGPPDQAASGRAGQGITAAGVSSGSTWACCWPRGSRAGIVQAIQLGIEYDPQPPFDAGSTEKAPPEIVELVRTVAAART